MSSSCSSFMVHGAQLRGVEALPVTVEVSMAQGIPGITIVGLPDAALLEARHRVRSAIRSAGFSMPRLHVTVNLHPSELRKSGTGFDLPIAVGILACSGEIPTTGLDGCLFCGELGLTGEVSVVRGMVAHWQLARREGLALVCARSAVCSPDDPEAPLVVGGLAELKRGVRALTRGAAGPSAPASVTPAVDFGDVIDQEVAKRAMILAATGGHGLLMVGPPGAGKTMLARRMPTILPPLSDDERSEVLLIHSVAGQPLDGIRAGIRPFRAPHHSVSAAGLIGGGRPVLPGEVSLAHRGVLFLDELPQFGPATLQNLRQPLEDKEVRIVRADGTYAFPCDFQFVAAANPCPCGHLGDPGHVCRCPPARVEAYQARIGGPLMDRIDVCVDVARPSSDRVIQGEEGLSSADMAEQVTAGREFASWRAARHEGPEGESELSRVGFAQDARAYFEGFARRQALGGRAIVRIARVARTVADVAQHELVATDDVRVACLFRSRATLGG